MGIPCRPRAFRRAAWGRASVRPVEFTGRETVFVACGVQRAGRRSLWRSREEKPKRPLDLWGPEGGGRCLSERPNKRLRPPDLHVDAAADNAMLVNFNAQQASASQVHGMKNRHIGAGRAFSRPSRHPSSAPTRAAMRMFRFRSAEMRRISSSLSEKSNRSMFSAMCGSSSARGTGCDHRLLHEPAQAMPEERIDHTNDAVERHPSFSAPTLLIARLKLSAS